MEDEEPNTPRRYSWKKLTQTAKSSRGFSPRFLFLHFSTVLCGIFSARLGVNLMEKYAPANKSFALFIFFFFWFLFENLWAVDCIQSNLVFSGGLANSANELRHCATTQWTCFHWESKIGSGKGGRGGSRVAGLGLSRSVTHMRNATVKFWPTV